MLKLVSEILDTAQDQHLYETRFFTHWPRTSRRGDYTRLPGLGHVLRDIGVAAGKDGHCLVKRHPQRLGLG